MAEIIPFPTMRLNHYSTGSRQFIRFVSSSARNYIIKAAFFKEGPFSYHLDTSRRFIVRRPCGPCGGLTPTCDSSSTNNRLGANHLAIFSYEDGITLFSYLDWESLSFWFL